MSQPSDQDDAEGGDPATATVAPDSVVSPEAKPVFPAEPPERADPEGEDLVQKAIFTKIITSAATTTAELLETWKFLKTPIPTLDPAVQLALVQGQLASTRPWWDIPLLAAVATTLGGFKLQVQRLH